MYSYVVRHADGLIVVDTGVGTGNPWIDEQYKPQVVEIRTALNEAGFDERDVRAVINTHLHFDHCGQNAAFRGTPVFVQHAEMDALVDPTFTVAGWAAIPEQDLRVIDGDTTVAVGVRIVATPGHSPGHQSVVLDGPDGTFVIVGQCCYTSAEFAQSEVLEADMHEPGWVELGRESVRRLHALAPTTAYFSHDKTTYVNKP